MDTMRKWMELAFDKLVYQVYRVFLPVADVVRFRKPDAPGFEQRDQALDAILLGSLSADLGDREAVILMLHARFKVLDIGQEPEFLVAYLLGLIFAVQIEKPVPALFQVQPVAHFGD